MKMETSGPVSLTSDHSAGAGRASVVSMFLSLLFYVVACVVVNTVHYTPTGLGDDVWCMYWESNKHVWVCECVCMSVYNCIYIYIYLYIYIHIQFININCNVEYMFNTYMC